MKAMHNDAASYQDFSKNFFSEMRLNIARYRKEAGLTQEGLAARTNISKGHISKIEARNSDTIPSLETLALIAYELGIPPYLLFMREEDWREQ